MNYYKVVDPSFPPFVIDSKIVNYGLSLEDVDSYHRLLSFVVQSSLKLGLPLDFYLLFHNRLTRERNEYLQNLPKSNNGTFKLTQLVEAEYPTDHWVKEEDLINLVLEFNQIGYFNFEGGNYLWEFVFEHTRKKNHPHLPPRSDCFFLFGSVKDCRHFQKVHNKAGVTRRVNLIETRSLISADMRILNDIPTYATAKYAIAEADRYWSGQRSDQPVIEYLFQGVCTVEGYPE